MTNQIYLLNLLVQFSDMKIVPYTMLIPHSIYVYILMLRFSSLNLAMCYL
jgi:hypothetical protein